MAVKTARSTRTSRTGSAPAFKPGPLARGTVSQAIKAFSKILGPSQQESLKTYRKEAELAMEKWLRKEGHVTDTA